MRKLTAYSFIFLILTSITFVAPAHVAHAQVPPGAVAVSNFVGGGATKALSGGLDVILSIPGALASYVLLPLAGWITTLTGLLLNFVVNATVVHMADKLAQCPIGVTPCSGIGDVINTTWTTVRDVANMMFIFALLYTAILTIFGQGNYKRTILNLIIAAILINFSLFFTKVIIDFGNLVALLFYHHIIGPQLPGDSAFDTGISNALMDQLHLTSIWKSTGVLNGSRLVTIGVMGTIFALIAAFVFLAVAIMFVIRFVVLIFVLILSPLMFLGLILPGQKGVTKQWLDALVGQTFFAPIYFFLTWIVVQLGQGLYNTLGIAASDTTASALAGTYDASGKFIGTTSTFGILLNFVMMIAFLIMSLVISKKYADKSGSLVSGATKWATGFAIGTTSKFGRATLGRAGTALGDNDKLKDVAANGNLVTSRLARLSLAAGRKTSESSFDARGSGLGKVLGGGQAPKGGFAGDNKKKIERETKFAQSLKPSDIKTGEADAALAAAQKTSVNDASFKQEWSNYRDEKQKTMDLATRMSTAARASGDVVEMSKWDNAFNKARDEFRSADDIVSYKNTKVTEAQRRADEIKGVSEEELRKRQLRKIRLDNPAQNEKWAKEELKRQESIRYVEVQKNIEAGMSEDEAKKAAKTGWAPEPIKGLSTQRQEAYATDLATAWPVSRDRVFFIGKIRRENRQAAIDIRKKLKEKKPADKIAEEIAAQSKQAADEPGETASTTTPPPTSSTPPAGTPPTP